MSTSTALIIAAAAVVVVVVVFSLRKRGRKRLERVQDPYVQGLKALVDGDREGAFAMLQRSVKSGNAPVDAYLRLGRMLRESGEVGKALQIHKSLTVKSDMTREEKVQLFVDVAEDYSKLGRSKQAVHVLETAVRGMGLKDAEVFRILAKEYHLLGNVEQAYQCLKDLKRLDAVGDRELALYLSSAGEQKAEAGELKEARKILHRALKHDSDSPAARVALGNIEDQLGEQEAALQNWKHAALASPELAPEALKNLERVMFQRGTFGEIERVYRAVLEARPWDEYATLALASFYRKQGRGADAVDFLEEFRSSHPESIGTTLSLTSLYATQGDQDFLERFLEDAEEYFSRRSARVCGVCGFQSTTMRWHCPRCNGFDTFSVKNES